MTDDPSKPNPGSMEARLGGCICPVAENNRGERMPFSGWLYDDRCPLHGDGREPVPA